MGFRICYIAAKIEPAKMAHALGLKIGDTTDEIPSAKWWLATLKQSGWTILWADDETFSRKSRALLAELASTTDIYHCEVNETVMWSSCEFWESTPKRGAVVFFD